MAYYTIRKKRADASGKIGQYIQLTKDIGVKIIGFWGCKNIKNLHNSITWVKAMEEAKWIAFVSSSDLAPNCYGVHPVKFNGRFFAGVFMDHINGVSLNSVTKNGSFQQGSKVYVNKKGVLNENKVGVPIRQFLTQKLKKIGLNHFDIHGENVLVDKKKRIWLIDFSSDYISKKKK